MKPPLVYGHLTGTGDVLVSCPWCRQWHRHPLADGMTHPAPCSPHEAYRVVLRVGRAA